MILPDSSFSTMYGPVATWFSPYAVGCAPVELLRVLLRHGRRGGHRERGGHDGAARGVELEDDRLVVRGLDPRDLLRVAVLERLQALRGCPCRRRRTDRRPGQEAALEPVLDVGRGDLAVDRRAELHAGADLHRDRHAVLGDLRRPLGEVGLQVARVVGLDTSRAGAASRRRRSCRTGSTCCPGSILSTSAAYMHDQVTALLGLLLRAAALLRRRLLVVAPAPRESKDERGPQGQCDTSHR